jgi:hypothetical protein
MIEYTSLTEMPSLTIEADLADWAEQRQTVILPDDEYPRLGEQSARLDLAS